MPTKQSLPLPQNFLLSLICSILIRRLLGRMEGGYGVCASGVEITAEQYVELAETTAKYAATPGVKLALNKALQDGSISDCDYRVLLTLTSALKKEGQKPAIATNS
jgi:hypothetical protein